MKLNLLKACAFVLLVAGIYSCQKEAAQANQIPDEIISKIENLGFNPDGIVEVPEGYRIERDIILTHEYLASKPEFHYVPNQEQYSTDNLVTTGGNRVITVYINAADNTGNSVISNNNGKGNGNGGGGGPGGGGPGGRGAPGITNLMTGRYNYLMALSEFTATEPAITDIAVSNDQPYIGETISINCEATSTNFVQLKYRHEENKMID